MLFKPPLHRYHSALVRLRRWVWSVEDSDLVEQHDRDSTAFAFADLGAQANQQCFDVLPGDVRAGGVCEDCFQSPLMGALHDRHGTGRRYRTQRGWFLMPNYE